VAVSGGAPAGVEGAGVVDGALRRRDRRGGADVGGACAAGGAGSVPGCAKARPATSHAANRATPARAACSRVRDDEADDQQEHQHEQRGARMPATIRCCGLTDVAIASWSRRLRTPKKLDQTATTICKKLADEAGAEGGRGRRDAVLRASEADRKSRGGAARGGASRK